MLYYEFYEKSIKQVICVFFCKCYIKFILFSFNLKLKILYKTLKADCEDGSAAES